jgi:hypothetical protein
MVRAKTESRRMRSMKNPPLMKKAVTFCRAEAKKISMEWVQVTK